MGASLKSARLASVSCRWSNRNEASPSRASALPKLFSKPLDVTKIQVPPKPVCTGIVVQGDPAIDPEIIIPVPQGPVEYKLWIIEPPCEAPAPKAPQPPATTGR